MPMPVILNPGKLYVRPADDVAGAGELVDLPNETSAPATVPSALVTARSAAARATPRPIVTIPGTILPALPPRLPVNKR